MYFLFFLLQTKPPSSKLSCWNECNHYQWLCLPGRERCTVLNICRHFPILFCQIYAHIFSSYFFIWHTGQCSCFHFKAFISLEHINSSIMIQYWNTEFCNSHWRRKYPTKWSNRISIVNFLLLHLKFLHFLIVLLRVPCFVTRWIIN